MEEDEPKLSKKEEKAMSVLDMAKAEREVMEKAVEENKKLLNEIKEIRATDILSGRVNSGVSPPKPVDPNDLSPEQYLQAFRSGQLKAKLPGVQ